MKKSADIKTTLTWHILQLKNQHNIYLTRQYWHSHEVSKKINLLTPLCLLVQAYVTCIKAQTNINRNPTNMSIRNQILYIPFLRHVLYTDLSLCMSYTHTFPQACLSSSMSYTQTFPEACLIHRLFLHVLYTDLSSSMSYTQTFPEACLIHRLFLRHVLYTDLSSSMSYTQTFPEACLIHRLFLRHVLYTDVSLGMSYTQTFP